MMSETMSEKMTSLAALRSRVFMLLLLLPSVGCGAGLSLTLVDAAYKKPSNVAVYFTVDTADDEPVPGLEATDFRIYEDGQLVSIDESQQTIVNPEATAEHYTLLLVDMSGSVTESDQVPQIVSAAQEFTSTIEGHQRVAVYAFDGSPDIHPIQPFTGSSGASSRGVGRLNGFRPKDPSTNLYGAVVQAGKTLDEALSKSKAPLRFGTIVVFTDGTDRAARVTVDEMMDAMDEAAYDVFAIGVGNEIDEDTLSHVGRSGYVLVQDVQAVTRAFKAIGDRIVGYTQRFYLLSYCSPARAGMHEVTVEAVVGEATGDLSYEFDATGFGPRCDPTAPPPFETAGNARAQLRKARRGSRVGARINLSASGSVSAE